MYSVLVPFDADEKRAIAQGEMVLGIADEAESVEATLLHVIEPSGRRFTGVSGVQEAGTVGTPTDEGTGAAARGERIDPLELPAGERLHGMLTEAGVTVRVERRSGAPAEAILAVGRETAADQIVMGGRKRSPLGTLLFGSVTHAVILDADRPVTVTGAEIKQDPSHRCRNCGQSYYTDPETEIGQCQRCGGTHVEPLQEVAR